MDREPSTGLFTFYICALCFFLILRYLEPAQGLGPQDPVYFSCTEGRAEPDLGCNRVSEPVTVGKNLSENGFFGALGVCHVFPFTHGQPGVQLNRYVPAHGVGAKIQILLA